MVAVFRCLGPDGGNFHVPCEPNTKLWDFTAKNIPININQKSNFLRPLIQKQLLLHTEYSLHCTQLVLDMMNKKKSKGTQQAIEQIQTALMMAELLEQINHRDYLNVPEKLNKIRLEQKIYRHWLAQQGFQFSANDQNIKTNRLPIGKTIRHLTSKMSWLRLFSLRFRQLLITILRSFNDMHGSFRWISIMEEFSKPIVAYFVWLFYVPRLFTELFFTAKHTLPHPWMNSQERNLGLITRLKAQWDERWFFLTHDAAWLSCGLVTCFVLIGALAPVSIYLLCAMQAFDVVLAGIRGYIEISRLQKLKKEYVAIRQQTAAGEQQEQLTDFIHHINRRIEYERSHRNLRIISNSILVLAVALAIPILMFNPVLPFVGALIAVHVTGATYATLKMLEKKKSGKSLSVVSISIFKPNLKLENTTPTNKDNTPNESQSSQLTF